MANKKVQSNRFKTKVDGEDLYAYTEVEYEVDDKGSIVPGSKVTTLYYNNSSTPFIDNYTQAARSKDGGVTWEFIKGLDGKTVLGESAQKSLGKPDGEFHKNTEKSVVEIAERQGLSQNEIDELTGKGEESQRLPGAVDIADENNPVFGKSTTRGDDAGLPGPGGAPLTYPRNMNPRQDHIEFRMIEYSPKKLSKDFAGVGGLGGFGERRDPYNATSKGTVILPIQSGITDLNRVDWTDDKLNPVDAYKSALFIEGLQKGVGASIEKLGEDASTALKNSEGRSDIQKAIASIFLTAATQKPTFLSRATGSIINPNLELLFNAPTLRPFSFSFRMSARNKPEADTIKNIIYFFKKGMAVKRTKTNLFLQAPNVFSIKYVSNGQEHTGINQIKECALVSCSINYIPDGTYSAHADGSMTAYEMRLEFNELEPVYFDEYDGSHPIRY